MSKIRDLIRLITNSSEDYDEKYMKTKLNSDDYLPLKKSLETQENVRNKTTNVRVLSHEDNK